MGLLATLMREESPQEPHPPNQSTSQQSGSVTYKENLGRLDAMLQDQEAELQRLLRISITVMTAARLMHSRVIETDDAIRELRSARQTLHSAMVKGRPWGLDGR